MNTYRYSFIATCPSDGEQIVYQLEITSRDMLQVEHLKTATSLIKVGYQEQIADELHERFGGKQRIVAIHQGVEIETLRGV